MHRCKERGFCCGAGGARMWMEERIGKRINVERIDEALGTNPDTISTGCPFCLVMLGDAVSAKKSSGEAKESLQVVDVAQLLARSVAGPEPAAPPAAAPAAGRGTRPRGRRPGGGEREAAMETRRAESFSDGVFAVAITVLVFNLLPIADTAIRSLSRPGQDDWPQYVGLRR